MSRRGVVRITQDVQATLPWQPFEAYWNPLHPGRERSEWSRLEDAVRWARQRAPVVIVTFGGWHHYEAGERDSSDRFPRLEGWPRRRSANRVTDYGGAAYVLEESPFVMQSETFTALWLDEDGTPLDRVEGIEEVEAAIDWGRERAPVVLVAEVPGSWSGGPYYVIRSAGEHDPPGAQLERLRPAVDGDSLVWRFDATVGLTHGDVGGFARELAAALADDARVERPVVERVTQAPMTYSLAFVSRDEASESPQHSLHEPTTWLTLGFEVRAPTRPAATETAHAVFLATVNAARPDGRLAFGPQELRSLG